MHVDPETRSRAAAPDPDPVPHLSPPAGPHGAKSTVEVGFHGLGGQCRHLVGDRRALFLQDAGQVPAQGPPQQDQPVRRQGTAPATTPAQDTTLHQIEGDQHTGVLLAAGHAHIQHGGRSLEDQHLEEEGGRHHGRIPLGQGGHSPHQHLVQPRVAVPLLGPPGPRPRA